MSLGDITSVALEKPQLSSHPQYDAHILALNKIPSPLAQQGPSSASGACTLPGFPVPLAVCGVELKLLDPRIGISSRIICVYSLGK